MQVIGKTIQVIGKTIQVIGKTIQVIGKTIQVAGNNNNSEQMKIFPITFKVGCLELEAIVTQSDNDHRFKVEMVTGEPDPIVLRRDDHGAWTVENSGGRTISAEGFNNIQKEIEASLTSI